MSDRPDTEAPLTASELEVADLLGRDRPLPDAQFRGALGRRLASLDPGWGPRPARLMAIVCAYLGLAAVLIGLGALSGLGSL
jgi:hypothetical protein